MSERLPIATLQAFCEGFSLFETIGTIQTL